MTHPPTEIDDVRHGFYRAGFLRCQPATIILTQELHKQIRCCIRSQVDEPISEGNDRDYDHAPCRELPDAFDAHVPLRNLIQINTSLNRVSSSIDIPNPQRV